MTITEWVPVVSDAVLAQAAVKARDRHHIGLDLASIRAKIVRDGNFTIALVRMPHRRRGRKAADWEPYIEAAGAAKRRPTDLDHPDAGTAIALTRALVALDAI